MSCLLWMSGRSRQDIEMTLTLHMCETVAAGAVNQVIADDRLIDASLGSLSVTLSVSPLSVVRRRITPPGVLGGTDEPGGQEASARCPRC